MVIIFLISKDKHVYILGDIEDIQYYSIPVYDVISEVIKMGRLIGTTSFRVLQSFSWMLYVKPWCWCGFYGTPRTYCMVQVNHVDYGLFLTISTFKISNWCNIYGSSKSCWLWKWKVVLSSIWVLALEIMALKLYHYIYFLLNISLLFSYCVCYSHLLNIVFFGYCLISKEC
jgi:hypothetical protein